MHVSTTLFSVVLNQISAADLKLSMWLCSYNMVSTESKEDEGFK